MSLIDTLLGIVAPHYCLGCGSEGRLLCPECGGQLQTDSASLLPLSAVQTLSVVYAAAIYEGLAKDLIWQLKYRGARAAAKQMAELLHSALPRGVEMSCIVPVPTASGRVRRRGYDQAVLLARELSRMTGYPLLNCLNRRGQAHQVGARRRERLQQLQGAFRIKSPAPLLGAHILLVDDVLTTGATLEAAARALKAAGAAKISAVVFAQA